MDVCIPESSPLCHAFVLEDGRFFKISSDREILAIPEVFYSICFRPLY